MRNGNNHPDGWFARLGERRTPVLFALAALAFLTYLPFLSLPPMQDDYLQVHLAGRYGSPSGWMDLLHDPLYRCRATSILLTAATLHLFGWSLLSFHLTSLALHVLNVLLIAALGSSRKIGWPVSLVAAFIFAARERHHEAVIWYASLHEPLALLFALLALLSLICWLEGDSKYWLVATALASLAALASKESGVLLAAILPALVWLYPERRRALAPLLAASAAITAVYFLLAFSRRSEHQHFNDGTFSFQANVARTLLYSAVRGLWIWGGLSLAAVAAYRAKLDFRLLAFGATWFLAGLLPYSFLTYMPRIPSRHHYLASVGFAIIAAIAFQAFIQSRRRRSWIAATLACAFLLHNWTYLWVSKKPQFEWRAALIEDFVTFVAEKPGRDVVNGCGDLNSDEAKKALSQRLGLDSRILIPASAQPADRVYPCPPAPKS